MIKQKPQLEHSKKWRALILLSLTLIFSMSTMFSASAIIPQLRGKWDFSPLTSSLIMIAIQIGFVIGALFTSIINFPDIISPRFVILVGAIGSACANTLIITAGNISTTIALRLITGFFLAGVYPPTFKLLATWFQKDRAGALGILVAALVVGNGMPHLINGLGGLNWQLVIYATSILTLLGGFIAVFLVKEGPFPFPTAVFDPSQIRQIFTNRDVSLASLGYIGHMWELFAMFTWYAIFLSDALASNGVTSGSTAALLTFTIFVAGAAGSWCGGILADRWGKIKTTILFLAISGMCTMIIGFLYDSPPWVIVIAGMVWGFSVVGDSAQFSTIVTERADQSYVGTALTMQLAAGFSITVVTIWLIPLVQTWIGWQWAFIILAPGPILGIISMLRLLKSDREKEQNKTVD